MAASAQRRTLALLAILARAGVGGVSRGRVAALLWPESGEEQARNALRQALFRLRRELGSSEVVVGTAQLRLNPDVIASDVAELEAALEAGELERAAALYRGPFLDGFTLPNAPEFERWVDAERAALAQRASAVLARLACDADRRGDRSAAVSCWRRLVALDPLSTTSTLGLMRALVAAGGPTEALRHARVHEAMVRAELGIEPDRAVARLVDEIRAASLGAPAAPAPRAAPPTPVAPPAGRAAGTVMGAAAGDASSARGSAGADPAPGVGAARWTLGSPLVRRRGRAVMLTALVVGAAGAGWLAVRAGGRRAGAAPSPDLVAVFPFAVRGGARHAHLGAAAGDRLSAALDGAGRLRTTDRHVLRPLTASSDPAAQIEAARRAAGRLGAGRFVVGDVVVTGDRLVLTATLYPASERASREGRLAEATVECDPASLAAAVDRLAIRLLAAAPHAPVERFAQAAALATRSLPALKSFLAGEAHFRAGRYGPAVDAYERAVQEDTTFALGYYRMGVAADWAGRQDAFDRAVERATRFDSLLADHDRLLLRGLVAWHRGDARAAEPIYRTVVTRYPDDVEAWYQLGETQFHLSPAYGSPVLDARPAFTRVLALQPDNREAMVHLQRLAAKARDRRQVDALARRFLVGASGVDSTLVVVLRAFSVGDSAAREGALALLERASDETVLHGAIRTAVHGEDLAGARRIARLLTFGPRGRAYQLTGTAYVGYLEMAMGRRASANAVLGTVDRELGVSALGVRATLATLPLVPTGRAELEALRDSVRRWPGGGWLGADSLGPANAMLLARSRPWVLGLLGARLGDGDDVLRQADELERVGRDSFGPALDRDLAQVLRAELARARGDLQGALALAASETHPLPPLGWFASLPGSRAHQRYLRGELLARLGRDDEALRWFASIGGLAVPELVFLAPAALRQAEIHERRGDRARATAHYRRFVELWRECEPELRPIVREAERRLARLAAR